MEKLVGTEKQVAWAEKIRTVKIEHIERVNRIAEENITHPAYQNKPGRIEGFKAKIARNKEMLKVFLGSSAKAIIENRDYDPTKN